MTALPWVCTIAADLGPVLADQGVHRHLGGRPLAPVDLLAVQGHDGDVLGLEHIVLGRGGGAGQQVRLDPDADTDVAGRGVDQPLGLQLVA